MTSLYWLGHELRLENLAQKTRDSMPNGALFPMGTGQKVVHYTGNRVPFFWDSGKSLVYCREKGKSRPVFKEERGDENRCL